MKNSPATTWPSQSSRERNRKASGFPGALKTFTIEAMVQDRKAIQAGTSHFLGQNFAHASGIKFLSRAGAQEFAWTTSWGVSTRLVGTLIMTHGDDDGMIVPPRIAPTHVVILPVCPKPESREAVLAAAESLRALLAASLIPWKPCASRSGCPGHWWRSQKLGVDQEGRADPGRVGAA